MKMMMLISGDGDGDDDNDDYEDALCQLLYLWKRTKPLEE